jgi:uncharacterized protein YabN with tetrapyrrole methylase and pyrophosphatase domain
VSPGSLVVVGTGIKLAAHATLEARQWIERAGKVLYVVADAAVVEWIRRCNPAAESLNPLYEPGKPRLQTYEEMVDAILAPVRQGLQVCAVFYGHPGVFVYPSHKAIERARGEGFQAWMCPGVSAEDCLFADLGVDPGSQGCQSYEATHFLVRQRRFDPCTPLILWQIGVIADLSVREEGTRNEAGLQALIGVLAEAYGPDHTVVVYKAAQWPIGDASIQRVPLARLAEAEIDPLSTLYVPPLPDIPLDQEMIGRLGLRTGVREVWKARNREPSAP